MAKAAEVRLPRSPWHVANIWWDFQQPVGHFTSLEMEVTCTWFTCSIRDAAGAVHEVGGRRFEGMDFTFWAKHSAFVEGYSTAKIPKSGIPKVNVTFGWPRLNGQKVALGAARAYYPDKPPQDSPDCAWINAEGEACVVEVGPIFKRDETPRRHGIPFQVLKVRPEP